MKTPIKMEAVTSSQLAAVGYDPESETMAIRFKNGSLYHYYHVSAEQHHALVSAESIGKHFTQNVKWSFEYQRQEEQ
jgi:hypothetical protein